MTERDTNDRDSAVSKKTAADLTAALLDDEAARLEAEQAERAVTVRADDQLHGVGDDHGDVVPARFVDPVIMGKTVIGQKGSPIDCGKLKESVGCDHP